MPIPDDVLIFILSKGKRFDAFSFFIESIILELIIEIPLPVSSNPYNYQKKYEFSAISLARRRLYLIW